MKLTSQMPLIGDIKERGLAVLEPVTMLYLPIRQDETNNVSLVVRGDGGVTHVAPGIAKVLRSSTDSATSTMIRAWRARAEERAMPRPQVSQHGVTKTAPLNRKT